MLFKRTQTFFGVLTMLVFASLILLPCLCSTAMAHQGDEPAEEEGCCPNSEEPTEPNDGDDDCCGACSISGDTGETRSSVDGAAVVSSFDADKNLDGPSLWWSPDLVATLWLADRLAASSTTALRVEFDPPDIRPDRSRTYLEHSTLLL